MKLSSSTHLITAFIVVLYFSCAMAHRLPVLFVSHGGPNLVQEPQSAPYKFMSSWASTIPRPKAILSISAHWETHVPTLTTPTGTQETIHDFGGFDESLYQIKYPVSGNPDLVRRVGELLKSSQIAFKENPKRGLDHGSWVPLSLIYPKADIPVVQLSLFESLSPSAHLQLGKALAPLRDEGYLIFASGSLTHNLYGMRGPTKDLIAGNKAFSEGVQKILATKGKAREEALLDWEKIPGARLAHPREEHFMPLFVALGAAGTESEAKKVHDSWYFDFLSMESYQFE